MNQNQREKKSDVPSEVRIFLAPRLGEVDTDGAFDSTGEGATGAAAGGSDDGADPAGLVGRVRRRDSGGGTRHYRGGCALVAGNGLIRIGVRRHPQTTGSGTLVVGLILLGCKLDWPLAIRSTCKEHSQNVPDHRWSL